MCPASEIDGQDATAALQDTLDLYNDLMSCTASTCSLPAVSFVKPSGYLDGHPASSKVNLLEGFVKKIVQITQANSTLAADTAIFITFDEGGGYYDSGYIPLQTRQVHEMFWI